MHTSFDLICLHNQYVQWVFQSGFEQYNMQLNTYLNWQQTHAKELAEYEAAEKNLVAYIQSCIDVLGFMPAYAEYRRRNKLVPMQKQDIPWFIIRYGAYLPEAEELAFTSPESQAEYAKRYAEAKQVFLLLPSKPACPPLPTLPEEPNIIQYTEDLPEALQAISYDWEGFCDFAYDQYWTEQEISYANNRLSIHMHGLIIELTERS